MFILKSMKDIYFSSNGESDLPHWHDYYAIILLNREKEFIMLILKNTK